MKTQFQSRSNEQRRGFTVVRGDKKTKDQRDRKSHLVAEVLPSHGAGVRFGDDRVIHLLLYTVVVVVAVLVTLKK